MPCLHLLISGRVQGVWFRESMRQEALKLGATGWVRNLEDGRVEAVICGNKSIVDSLLKWAKSGPSVAEVEGVVATAIPEEGFTTFEKRA